MTVDYLIIGQGLAGSFLSWNLLKEGKKVLVIDEYRPESASRVASGVINPVTGRRMVRSWMIETLMPYAVQSYREMGKSLNVEAVTQCNIIDFHPTPQMKLAFLERLPEEKEYLRLPSDEQRWEDLFNYNFGFGEIDPCWLIDLNSLLPAWRAHLRNNGALLETTFSLEDCTITEDKVTYKDITASKLFFCDGAAGMDNPYFHLLPFARNKGEALIVDIPGLPRNKIFKQGINIVPWKDGLFWIGSSFEWEFENLLPSNAFLEKTTAQLRHWLKLPFTIEQHLSSERPATLERRPFVGLHPLMHSVGILNGFGTKGCTLAPYFAAQLTANLLHGQPIEPLADVKRFMRVLSRTP